MATETDKDTTYNGWSNYETWAMSLWIDNDHGSYDESRLLAQEAHTAVENRHARSVNAAGHLAQTLREWQETSYDETAEKLAGTVWADLLGAAWSEVDWYEIAESYLSEIAE